MPGDQESIGALVTAVKTVREIQSRDLMTRSSELLPAA